MARSSLPAVAWVLICCAAKVAAQGNSRTVKNDRQLYSAIIDQSVTSVALAYDGASLAPYSQALNGYVAEKGPFPIQRSLTIYGAVSGVMPSLDFAYLATLLTMTPGIVFTIDGLALSRMQAMRSPVGIFSTSQGGTVIVRNCVYTQQSCWPHEAAQYLFLNRFERAASIPGVQTATFCPANTEDTCKQYTFNDIAFTVDPSKGLQSGSYTLQYFNTIVRCQAYPKPIPQCAALTTDPFGCIRTVYDPANQQVICPTCSCINTCRTNCDQNLRLPQNAGC